MNGFDNDIHQVVQKFVDQVTQIAQRAAHDALTSMFGANGAASALNGTSVAKSPALVPASSPVGRGRPSGGRGVKRAPEYIEAMGQKFAAFVKANPGLRVEQINKELGTTTKDLALPIRKLEAEGVITTKGQRRATQYFPGKKAK